MYVFSKFADTKLKLDYFMQELTAPKYSAKILKLYETMRLENK
jgi:hypothetical protein